MGTTEAKLKFIELRAKGQSYSEISKELGISKGTCSSWESELQDKIAELESEKLKELYQSYYMLREQRIKNLGDTLSKIDDVLDEIDLREVPAEKLLDFKLKYTEMLKREYIDLNRSTEINSRSAAEDILAEGIEVLNDLRKGRISEEQASREVKIISEILRGYQAVELEDRLELLETVINGRVKDYE